MARIVVKTAHGPHVLTPQDKPVKLCMCGLSKNQPFCDTSHLKTLDEEDGKIYIYDEEGKRHEEEECCGEGECCCHEDGHGAN